jgi:methionine synthase II (cobalamin-independent)
VDPSGLHVDHVGSLLRPAALKEKRFGVLGVHDADHNLGAHRNDELTKIEDGCIRDVVKLQEECGLKPLCHVPKGKKILLGIVSTKDPKLESKDELTRRIDEAAKHVGMEQLGICPQCGFSTNVFGTEFNVEDESRKIERMVEVADAVWGA